jgi:hypothetical protein
MNSKFYSGRTADASAQAGASDAVDGPVLDTMFFHGESAIKNRRPTRLSLELINRARERETDGSDARRGAEGLHREESVKEAGQAGSGSAR